MERQLGNTWNRQNCAPAAVAIAAWIALSAVSGTVNASVTEFTNRAQWEAAIGTYTTIDFTGFPDNTFITTQYQHLGVTFVDGDDNTYFFPLAFPSDSWGLDGNQLITIDFTTPQNWLAIDFPDAIHIRLYNDGQLVYSSSNLGVPGLPGLFAGLVSSTSFDRVQFSDWTIDEVYLDNLYFGVPSPGAAVLLGMWLVPMTSRRRQRWSTAWKPSVPLLTGSLCIVGFGSDARASVTEYTNRAQWEAAIGTYTTIDFTGFPDNTFITTQYQHLGVTFVDGDDNTYFFPLAFPSDSWGLDGNQSITIDFTTLHSWLAFDFVDDVTIKLYRSNSLIYSSPIFGTPGTVGSFAGILSAESFDRVVLQPWTSIEIGIDNFYFGVPSPGAAVLLGMWLVPMNGSRRRRD